MRRIDGDTFWSGGHALVITPWACDYSALVSGELQKAQPGVSALGGILWGQAQGSDWRVLFTRFPPDFNNDGTAQQSRVTTKQRS